MAYIAVSSEEVEGSGCLELVHRGGTIKSCRLEEHRGVDCVGERLDGISLLPIDIDDR